MNDIVASQDLGALLQLHEAEFDRQIATAKRYPRSVGKAQQNILAYATASEDVAAECNYAVPRGGKVIQGPSVRLAEIVGTCWGNARYASRIIEEKKDFVVAQAVFHDLEINNFVSIEVQRSIVNSSGGRYNVDMIGVTSQAAMSIAMRNAIFKGVPRAIWGDAYAQARAMVAGTIESLDHRRGAAFDAFKKLGATEGMVLELLSREHVKDVQPDDLVTLRGVLTSIRDGESTFRNVFGEMQAAPGRGSKADVDGALKRGRAEAGAEKASAKDADKPKEDAVASQEEGASGAQAGNPNASGSVASASGSSASVSGGDLPPETQVGVGTRDAASDGAAGTVEVPAVVESPKLNETAATIFERDDLPDDWANALTGLVDALRAAGDTKAMNAAWDKLAIKFETAPEEVVIHQQALRSARRKDIQAASAASRSSAATKL